MLEPRGCIFVLGSTWIYIFGKPSFSLDGYQGDGALFAMMNALSPVSSQHNLFCLCFRVKRHWPRDSRFINRYCSAACQAGDWSRLHKHVCRSFQRLDAVKTTQTEKITCGEYKNEQVCFYRSTYLATLMLMSVKMFRINFITHGDRTKYHSPELMQIKARE